MPETASFTLSSITCEKLNSQPGISESFWFIASERPSRLFAVVQVSRGLRST